MKRIVICAVLAAFALSPFVGEAGHQQKRSGAHQQKRSGAHQQKRSGAHQAPKSGARPTAKPRSSNKATSALDQVTTSEEAVNP